MLDWQLYVILDRAAAGARDLTAIARQAIAGGADVVQLRDKTASVQAVMAEARSLRVVTREAGIPFIVNDRPDVALAVDADGVHLGQDDGPLSLARQILGPGKLVGRSTHSVAQAAAALAQGADYIGFGPVFATPTKPGYRAIGTGEIGQVVSQAPCPVVVIGGIDLSTVDRVLHAGARCVAVLRAVTAAPDPESAARALKQRIMAATTSSSSATRSARVDS
ncbi:MAG: thiamine phosphate synthase [Candidatus Omnitrophica bacterium]|nr:thiamine phosphate synthase [Candidatus Omnitrophota bacterium]